MASMIEFWDYLLQFVVSAIGCVMALVLYAKDAQTAVFFACLLFRNLQPGDTILDAARAASRYYAAGFLCVGTRVDCKLCLSAYNRTDSAFRRGKKFSHETLLALPGFLRASVYPVHHTR